MGKVVLTIENVCPQCRGTGVKKNKICPRCGGEGFVYREVKS